MPQVNVSELSKKESEYNRHSLSMHDRRLENIVWEFLYEDEETKLPLYDEWKKEYEELFNEADYRQYKTLKRFAAFYTRTIDKIASPKDNELIPEFLFDIRHLITQKLLNSNEQLEFLKSYIKLLNGSEKYDLGAKKKSDGTPKN